MERVQLLLCTSAEFVRLTWRVSKALGKRWVSWRGGKNAFVVGVKVDSNCQWWSWYGMAGALWLSTCTVAGWTLLWNALLAICCWQEMTVPSCCGLKECAYTPTGMLANIQQDDGSDLAQRWTECYRSRLSCEWPSPTSWSFLGKVAVIPGKASHHHQHHVMVGHSAQNLFWITQRLQTFSMWGFKQISLPFH